MWGWNIRNGSGVGMVEGKYLIKKFEIRNFGAELRWCGLV